MLRLAVLWLCCVAASGHLTERKSSLSSVKVIPIPDAPRPLEVTADRNLQLVQDPENDNEEAPLAGGSFEDALLSGESADKPLLPTIPLVLDETEELAKIQAAVAAAHEAEVGIIEVTPEFPPMDFTDASGPPPVDPGCQKIKDCNECMSNRKCGWCGSGRCVPSKNPKPECVHSNNVQVCPPVCSDMFHLNTPDGYVHMVQSLCNIIQADFSEFPEKQKVSFA
eukprot:c5324_g1_i1.p2 GENE.c5324_g1_i1~~c5324_g1_i1.p2  ORF type:complete len:224 (-),score=44.22 c5324_g1_i1:54-725(-)